MRHAALLLLVLGACKSDGPSLRVDLRTDLVPRFEFSSVRIELETNDTEGLGRIRTVTIDPSADTIAGVRLAEIGDLSNGDWRVRVTLLDTRGNGVLQRLTRTQIDGDTGITVLMTRDCEGVSCDDFAAEACLGGRCMDARCAPEQPEFCEAPPECTADTDCPSLEPCSEARCSDGFCFYATFDERCDPGQWCKPDDGCVPRPIETLDGGFDASFDSAIDSATDAPAIDGAVDGATDGGVDAGPFDAGGDVFGMTDGDVPDGCAVELCNGDDDDCDGVVDEAPSHSDCDFPGTTALCDPSAGVCSIVACEAGFEDCDSSPNNGCETTTALSELHCGRCDNPCGAGEWCDDGTCGSDRPLDLSVGDHTNCVRMLSGDTMCWGSGANGRHGNGGGVGSPDPRASGVRDLAGWRTAWKGTCAFDVAGDTVCYGRGLNGQWGGGTNAAYDVPTPQPHLDRFDLLELGVDHSCGIDGGRVWCWGFGANGRLGDGMTMARSMPVMTSVTGATDVAVGWQHTCAVDGTGSAFCWGNNGWGQIGDGSVVGTDTLSPSPVAGPMMWSAITVGRGFTCGLRSDARVSCWGDGRSGAMGNGSDTSLSTPGPLVTGLMGVSEVQAGPDSSFVCAIADPMRQVYCWGAGGALGSGSGAESNVPLAATGMDEVMILGVGERHVCVMRDDGGIWCWGDGNQGQLGDGMGTSSIEPVRVSGF